MRGEVAGCSQPLTAGLAGPTQGSGPKCPHLTGKRVSTGRVETASAQLEGAVSAWRRAPGRPSPRYTPLWETFTCSAVCL